LYDEARFLKGFVGALILDLVDKPEAVDAGL
jgi:hypothetical protein